MIQYFLLYLALAISLNRYHTLNDLPASNIILND